MHCTPVHVLKLAESWLVEHGCPDRTRVRLPWGSAMTRFQRVMLFSAGTGLFAVGLAYLIIVVLR